MQGTTVSLADSITGEPSEISAELVVVRTQLRVNDGIVDQLEGKVAALAVIGDCGSPRRMTHAILEANQVVRQFNAGNPVPYLWRSFDQTQSRSKPGNGRDAGASPSPAEEVTT